MGRIFVLFSVSILLVLFASADPQVLNFLPLEPPQRYTIAADAPTVLMSTPSSLRSALFSIDTANSHTLYAVLASHYVGTNGTKRWSKVLKRTCSFYIDYFFPVVEDGAKITSVNSFPIGMQIAYSLIVCGRTAAYLQMATHVNSSLESEFSYVVTQLSAPIYFTKKPIIWQRYLYAVVSSNSVCQYDMLTPSSSSTPPAPNNTWCFLTTSNTSSVQPEILFANDQYLVIQQQQFPMMIIVVDVLHGQKKWQKPIPNNGGGGEGFMAVFSTASDKIMGVRKNGLTLYNVETCQEIWSYNISSSAHVIIAVPHSLTLNRFCLFTSASTVVGFQAEPIQQLWSVGPTVPSTGATLTFLQQSSLLFNPEVLVVANGTSSTLETLMGISTKNGTILWIVRGEEIFNSDFKAFLPGDAALPSTSAASDGAKRALLETATQQYMFHLEGYGEGAVQPQLTWGSSWYSSVQNVFHFNNLNNSGQIPDFNFPALSILAGKTTTFAVWSYFEALSISKSTFASTMTFPNAVKQLFVSTRHQLLVATDSPTMAAFYSPKNNQERSAWLFPKFNPQVLQWKLSLSSLSHVLIVESQSYLYVLMTDINNAGNLTLWAVDPNLNPAGGSRVVFSKAIQDKVDEDGGAPSCTMQVFPDSDDVIIGTPHVIWKLTVTRSAGLQAVLIPVSIGYFGANPPIVLSGDERHASFAFQFNATHLQAQDLRKDGVAAILWTNSLKLDVHSPSSPSYLPSLELAAYGSSIFAIWNGTILSAYFAHNGQRLWSYNLERTIISNVFCYNGNVFVIDQFGVLYAFPSGVVMHGPLWNMSTTRLSYGSNVNLKSTRPKVEINGFLVLTYAHAVVAVDVLQRVPIWKIELQLPSAASSFSNEAVSAVVSGRLVLIASYQGLACYSLQFGLREFVIPSSTAALPFIADNETIWFQGNEQFSVYAMTFAHLSPIVKAATASPPSFTLPPKYTPEPMESASPIPSSPGPTALFGWKPRPVYPTPLQQWLHRGERQKNGEFALHDGEAHLTSVSNANHSHMFLYVGGGQLGAYNPMTGDPFWVIPLFANCAEVSHNTLSSSHGIGFLFCGNSSVALSKGLTIIHAFSVVNGSLLYTKCLKGSLASLTPPVIISENNKVLVIVATHSVLSAFQLQDGGKAFELQRSDFPLPTAGGVEEGMFGIRLVPRYLFPVSKQAHSFLLLNATFGVCLIQPIGAEEENGKIIWCSNLDGIYNSTRTLTSTLLPTAVGLGLQKKPVVFVVVPCTVLLFRTHFWNPDIPPVTSSCGTKGLLAVFQVNIYNGNIIHEAHYTFSTISASSNFLMGTTSGIQIEVVSFLRGFLVYGNAILIFDPSVEDAVPAATNDETVTSSVNGFFVSKLSSSLETAMYILEAERILARGSSVLELISVKLSSSSSSTSLPLELTTLHSEALTAANLAAPLSDGSACTKTLMNDAALSFATCLSGVSYTSLIDFSSGLLKCGDYANALKPCYDKYWEDLSDCLNTAESQEAISAISNSVGFCGGSYAGMPASSICADGQAGYDALCSVSTPNAGASKTFLGGFTLYDNSQRRVLVRTTESFYVVEFVNSTKNSNDQLKIVWEAHCKHQVRRLTPFFIPESTTGGLMPLILYSTAFEIGAVQPKLNTEQFAFSPFPQGTSTIITESTMLVEHVVGNENLQIVIQYSANGFYAAYRNDLTNGSYVRWPSGMPSAVVGISHPVSTKDFLLIPVITQYPGTAHLIVLWLKDLSLAVGLNLGIHTGSSASSFGGSVLVTWVNSSLSQGNMAYFTASNSFALHQLSLAFSAVGGTVTYVYKNSGSISQYPIEMENRPTLIDIGSPGGFQDYLVVVASTTTVAAYRASDLRKVWDVTLSNWYDSLMQFVVRDDLVFAASYHSVWGIHATQIKILWQFDHSFDELYFSGIATSKHCTYALTNARLICLHPLTGSDRWAYHLGSTTIWRHVPLAVNEEHTKVIAIVGYLTAEQGVEGVDILVLDANTGQTYLDGKIPTEEMKSGGYLQDNLIMVETSSETSVGGSDLHFFNIESGEGLGLFPSVVLPMNAYGVHLPYLIRCEGFQTSFVDLVHLLTTVDHSPGPPLDADDRKSPFFPVQLTPSNTQLLPATLSRTHSITSSVKPEEIALTVTLTVPMKNEKDWTRTATLPVPLPASTKTVQQPTGTTESNSPSPLPPSSTSATGSPIPETTTNVIIPTNSSSPPATSSAASTTIQPSSAIPSSTAASTQASTLEPSTTSPAACLTTPNGGLCNGHGTCHLDGHCICHQHYYTPDCSVFCSQEQCAIQFQMLHSPICTNNGSCACQDNDVFGHWDGAKCDYCKTFYWGANCTLDCPCHQHGTCDKDSGSICHCFHDDVNGYWRGPDCDIAVGTTHTRTRSLPISSVPTSSTAENTTTSSVPSSITSSVTSTTAQGTTGVPPLSTTTEPATSISPLPTTVVPSESPVTTAPPPKQYYLTAPNYTQSFNQTKLEEELKALLNTTELPNLQVTIVNSSTIKFQFDGKNAAQEAEKLDGLAPEYVAKELGVDQFLAAAASDTPNEKEEENGSNAGLIIGIVIGLLFLLFLIIVVFQRRKKKGQGKVTHHVWEHHGDEPLELMASQRQKREEIELGIGSGVSEYALMKDVVVQPDDI